MSLERPRLARPASYSKTAKPQCRAACPGSCSAATTVFPPDARRESVRITCAWWFRSRCCSGSSSSRMSASCRRTCAMRARWRSPPESVRYACVARLARSRAARGRRAFLVPAPGAPRVWIPAEHDVIERAAPEIGFLVLEQHGDAPGELAARVRGQRDAVERDRSGLRCAKAGEGEDEARLARAVAPEEGPERARREREVERANELAPACRESESGRFQHQRSLPRRKSSTGTPIVAVRTPTGSSAGAATVRASVSARASRPPPRHAQSGSSAPWRWMPESRSRWGTTSPTKPIEPPSRTAATVASVAQPKAMACRRVTATPSERALSSPRISTSSAVDCEKESAESRSERDAGEQHPVRIPSRASQGECEDRAGCGRGAGERGEVQAGRADSE